MIGGICKIRKGASQKDYADLVFDLYKNYPRVAKAKVAEFEKTFSSNNPFFKYGVAETFFVLKGNKVFGHIAAIVDKRAGNAGFIGFFECKNNVYCASLLFKQAIKFLADSDKKQCRGPINISVWQNSRVSYPEQNPPFYLEPFTLEYYRDLFLKNKFNISHQNITTTELIAKTKIKDYDNFYTQSVNDGYSYELLTGENAKEIIKDIYSLTNRIFEDSYSFYKISEEEFLYFAGQYIEIPKPHYIFILKNAKKESVGFFFAMPDLFNLELKRIVIKTIGVLPGYRGSGLVKAMFYHAYINAKKDGFKELVFSTMSVDNERIKSLTGQSLVLYRKYEVFEKNIL